MTGRTVCLANSSSRPKIASTGRIRDQWSMELFKCRISADKPILPTTSWAWRIAIVGESVQYLLCKEEGRGELPTIQLNCGTHSHPNLQLWRILCSLHTCRGWRLKPCIATRSTFSGRTDCGYACFLSRLPKTARR